MKWEKKGQIFSPDKTIWWQQYYGILPTPVHLPEEKVIRVFFASACKDKYGKISFIDLDENNPKLIINKHNEICLMEGQPGAFDDCGVNPSAILKTDNGWLLYYAGYQRHHRTPYSILSGLASSKDGIQFTRVKKTPVLERTETELSLRSAPTVIIENGIYRMWYVSDFGWKKMEGELYQGKLMPTYCLKYGTSKDGINWDVAEEPALAPVGTEFGFGRPYIYKTEKGYQLYYSIRREDVLYRLGYAESEDGIHWTRKDKDIGIDVSADGWDSEMICYPAVITVKNKTYLFYNGNNNGETGFGYAELINW